MPNIAPRAPEVHEPLSDAEIAALGLAEIEPGLTQDELRELRREALAYHGIDPDCEPRCGLRVTSFRLCGTRAVIDLVHRAPRPSAERLRAALAHLLATIPTGGAA